MLQNQIKTIKNMLSEVMIDLAHEAFKKGIKTTLVPSNCHYRGIASIEMVTKTGSEKFDYADVFANDIESIEKGVKFISTYGIKSEAVIAHSNSRPVDIALQCDPSNFLPASKTEFINYAERNGY